MFQVVKGIFLYLGWKIVNISVGWGQKSRGEEETEDAGEDRIVIF